MVVQLSGQTSQTDQHHPELLTSEVLGLPLHLADNYSYWLSQQLSQQQGAHVVTLNAEMAMQGDQDEALATVIRQADLVVPDGAGVVFYLGLRGQKIQRCPGIELAATLLETASTIDSKPSVFFYGGQPGVVDKATQYWQKNCPGLAIAGSQHGFVAPEEQESFCQQLQAATPSIVLVGLGVPRQEFWIAQHRHLCPNAIWMGVGGSLDVWAGEKERAPKWLRNHSLEWTYRLYKEPWRWRRMLALPQFAWRAIWER